MCYTLVALLHAYTLMIRLCDIQRNDMTLLALPALTKVTQSFLMSISQTTLLHHAIAFNVTADDLLIVNTLALIIAAAFLIIEPLFGWIVHLAHRQSHTCYQADTYLHERLISDLKSLIKTLITCRNM